MPRNPGKETILAAGLLAIMAGCQQQQSPGLKERQDLRDSWAKGEVTEKTVVQHPGSVAVKAGMSPLIYQARQRGLAHIQDVTTGAELASVSVARGSILRVDESAGVFADGKRLRPGPLAAGHEYTITMDLERTESWRSANVDAPPPRLPEEQPAKSPAQ